MKSYSNRQQSAWSTSSDKKFCSVCKNAGKSESEYTSHYTKSVPGPKGIVVCPTILQRQCNKCGNYGHFSNFCTQVKREIVKPKETIKVESFDDLFPPLSSTTDKKICGEKRDRDIKANQFEALTQEQGVELAKPMLNFKKAIQKEKPIVLPKEPEFPKNFRVLGQSVDTLPEENQNQNQEVEVESYYSEDDDDDYDQYVGDYQRYYSKNATFMHEDVYDDDDW